jgi:hypothetical protein
MIRPWSNDLPPKQAWALFFLALLLPMGLYFGFYAISMPAHALADQAQAAVPAQSPHFLYPLVPETHNSQGMLSPNLASWLLHQITQNWFRSILIALTILHLLLVVATVFVILPHN